MGAPDDLRDVRDSLTRATKELAAATDRLEALESRGSATVATPRWRRRDWGVAAGSSIATILVIALVGFAMPKAEPMQAIVVTTTAPPPKAAEPIRMEPLRVEPPAVVAQAPEPAPLPVIRPVAAKKPDAPSEPIRPARPRPESRDFSDVF